MTKRITAFFAALVLMIGAGADFNVLKKAYAEERIPIQDENVAEVYLGETVAENGFSKIGMGLTDVPSPSEKLGEECWLLDVQRNWQGCYMNFSMDEYMKPEKFDGSEYTIEVDYFDAGKGGFFRICYRDREGVFRTADLVYTQGELCWKTATVKISDAVFDGTCYDHNFGNQWRHGMCDFLIQTRAVSSGSTFSTETIAIKRVKVTREREKYPVYLSAKNDETGGMFKWYEESKIIHNTFENLTDKEQNITVKYRMEDSNHYNRFIKEETVSLAPNETKAIDLDFGEVNFCDIYSYYADITLADGTNYEFMPFKFAIIKTDPDGIKNDAVYFSGHIERYDKSLSDEYMHALVLSNSGGYRGEFQWQGIIDSNGAFVPETTKFAIAPELCKKYGLGFIPMLSSPPTNDMFSGWSHVPQTEKEIAAWCTFMTVAGTYLKDVTDTYELFNEPNLEGFNRFAKSPKQGKVYAAIAEASSEALKKVDPDARLGGPSLTGIGINPEDPGTLAPTFFKDAVEAGMYKSVDAIVLHPYANSMEGYEKSGRIEDIKWYKKLYEEKGVKDPEVWHTEMGFPQWQITDEQRGVQNIRTLLLFKAHDTGDISCIYNFEKKGVLDETQREDTFGYVAGGYETSREWGKNFFPTKSYLMIGGLNYLLADSEANGIYDPEGQNNVKITLYKSKKFNKDILALWSVDIDENVTLDLGINKIMVFDVYGNESELTSDDGLYSFVAGQAPVYLMGDFLKVEYKKDNKFEWETYEFQAAKNDIVTAKLNTKNVDKGYKISADLPEGAEIVEEGVFDGEGKGAIEIKNTYPAGEEYKATIYVTDSLGNRIHSAPVLIKSCDAVVSSMRLSMAEGNDINRWIATAKIQNISTSDVLKGTIKVKAPAEVSKSSAVDIGIIPRSTTGEISIGLPSLVKKGKFIFEYDITTDKGDVYSFKEPLDITIAPYAHAKPTIDGVLDKNEWAYDASMYADQGTQIKNIAGWGGTSDLSGKSAVMWDEENIYIYFDVTDDIFNCDTELSKHWNGDSIQLGVFYGEEGFVAMGQSSATFHEVGLAKAKDDTGAYRTLSTDNRIPSGKIKAAEVVIVRGEKKTVYEAKIPWDSLLFEGQRPKTGEKLGFSFLINDNDGTGRRGWIEYASGIGSGKNTQLFTYLTLIK